MAVVYRNDGRYLDILDAKKRGGEKRTDGIANGKQSRDEDYNAYRGRVVDIGVVEKYLREYENETIYKKLIASDAPDRNLWDILKGKRNFV